MFDRKNKKNLHVPFTTQGKSHKKRNVLIGLVSAVAAVVIAGATAKESDSK